MFAAMRIPPPHGTVRAAALACAVALLATGCGREAAPVQAAPGGAYEIPLFDASDALGEDWQHVRVWGETDWRLSAMGGEVVIDAVAEGTSSGLARWVEIDTGACPIAEWSWRVDALPPDADLSVRDREDVAASVIFVFGDPGSLSNPMPVPTLRYVWASANNAAGEIIDSPFFPGSLESIVVRSGTDALGRWVTERRDLVADYRRAFGEPPEEPVEAFALFTDNDHLEQPAVAHYRWARVLCGGPAPARDLR
jgi:hypothetical protein